MSDNEKNEAIDVDALTTRLAAIETEKSEIVERLRSVRAAVDEVLSAVEPGDAPAAKKPARKPAAKKPTAPRKPATEITPEQLSACVALVAAGKAKDAPANVLAAAKRKGLVTSTGRGRGATYAVAEGGAS